MNPEGRDMPRKRTSDQESEGDSVPRGKSLGIMTLSTIVRDVTARYLDEQPETITTADLTRVESELLDATVSTINIENSARNDKALRIPIPQRLDHYQISQVLLRTGMIIRLAGAGFEQGTEGDVLACYQDEGPDEGLYSLDPICIDRLARRLCTSISLQGQNGLNQVRADLLETCERVELTDDVDLVPVNNGIFDYKGKRLLPFDPSYRFLTKSHTDFVENATNPVITNPDGTTWNVEDWMHTITDDPEVELALWQVAGAAIRPMVPWDLTCWLYSPVGRNGKGTYCELVRSLCGPGTVASIPIKAFEQNFMLESLSHTSVIIGDENDTSDYLKSAANLKAVITQDPFQMNRKNKTAVSFRFKGFMIQCMNGMPAVSDQTASFYRRQLWIPMTKTFSRDTERKYIKHDYMHRTDVLEYVLHRLLVDMPDYYQIDIPAASDRLLGEYKEYNDPVLQFVGETLLSPDMPWVIAPFPWLYELFKAWFSKTNPSGTIMKNRTFNDRLRQIFSEPYDGWVVPMGTDGTQQQFRSKRIEGVFNPLSCTYKLEAPWSNPAASERNDAQRYAPVGLRDKYYGLIRTDASDGQET